MFNIISIIYWLVILADVYLMITVTGNTSNCSDHFTLSLTNWFLLINCTCIHLMISVVI